jgi:hypothetical protein
VILLLLTGGSAVGISAATLPDACRDHIDKINKALAAGDDDRAFYLTYQYFRARVQACHKRRPADADGFRRQAASYLADLAGQVHNHKPLEEFRVTSLISGGDWRP